MSGLLVALVLLPLSGAVTATVLGSRRAEMCARTGAVATAGSFVLAVALTVAVALGGPVSAVLTSSDGRLVVGLRADQIGVVLLLLVSGVSAVVQSFARRYLRGDAHAVRFFAATGLLTAATAVMVTSATLIGFAVAWTVAGVALCLLLGLYRTVPAARDGVRRTVRVFAIGDVALWLAVLIMTARWGNLDLRRLGDVIPSMTDETGSLTLVACLLVVAAMARSAQVPLQGWLPATLAAPTPVSALLHAGVVNAGGVLLVTMSPIFAAAPVAMYLAFAVGGVTAVYGTLLMLVKPDIKGALAHSTMGQMGFMIMTCGLGWFAAAVFHLVAHGMYKAALFLGSGSAIQGHVRHRTAPPLPAVPRATLVTLAPFAVLLPAAALLGAAAVLPAPIGGIDAEALLVFAWASGVWLTWGWLRRHPTPAGALVAVPVLAVVGACYVGLVGKVTGFLAPALAGTPDAGASPWLLAVVLAVMAAVTAVRYAPSGPGFIRELHKVLYVRALSRGHVTARPRPGLRRGRGFESAGLARLAPEVGR